MHHEKVITINSFWYHHSISRVPCHSNMAQHSMKPTQWLTDILFFTASNNLEHSFPDIVENVRLQQCRNAPHFSSHYACISGHHQQQKKAGVIYSTVVAARNRHRLQLDVEFLECQHMQGLMQSTCPAVKWSRRTNVFCLEDLKRFTPSSVQSVIQQKPTV